MAKKDPYREFLGKDFGELFENLELKDRQKHYLRSRWLDQVLWMEGRAGRARDLYYRLRLTTIIGGVIIPALVSLSSVSAGILNPGNPESNETTSSLYIRDAISWSAFVLSQVVAISAATEQFFNYGDRWRNYRRSVESLKTQGWQFFQLSGPYLPFKTHEEAFNTFASQVEQIIQQDVEIYATQITQPKGRDDDDDSASPSDPV
ncbi:MAG: DUF4231 domain-containing protein [Leptolyngbyaceae cyanobacterium RM2_2_4]|nr:DUF4231 domain-containing protein [Leptolyngbyaceae cyanobacterium SM1_4_3]NJO48572.1 DUF4231 domain-containing protein [Leptolyngbyaceae cyanobacterium RM2_2_4]